MCNYDCRSCYSVNPYTQSVARSWECAVHGILKNVYLLATLKNIYICEYFKSSYSTVCSQCTRKNKYAGIVRIFIKKKIFRAGHDIVMVRIHEPQPPNILYKKLLGIGIYKRHVVCPVYSTYSALSPDSWKPIDRIIVKYPFVTVLLRDKLLLLPRTGTMHNLQNLQKNIML